MSGTVATGVVTNIGGAVLLNGYAPNPSTEYNGLDSIDRAYSDMQNDLVNQTYVDLLEKSILKNRADARDAGDTFQAAVAAATLPTPMPDLAELVPFRHDHLMLLAEVWERNSLSLHGTIKQRKLVGLRRWWTSDFHGSSGWAGIIMQTCSRRIRTP